MARNPFDQFDAPAANPFDQFDSAASGSNPFDQFDAPAPSGGFLNTLRGVNRAINPLAAAVESTEVGRDLNSLFGGGFVTGAGRAIEGIERLGNEALTSVGDFASQGGEALSRTTQMARPFGSMIANAPLTDPGADRVPYQPSALSQTLKESGAGMQADVSPAMGDALRGSEFGGDIFSPSTWSLGDAPSVRGVAGQVAKVGGEMAPLVALGAVPVAGPALATGAAAGQSASGAYEDNSTFVMTLPDEQLAQIPEFQAMLESGIDPVEARMRLADEAGRGSMVPAAIIGAGSGAILSGAATRPFQRMMTERFGNTFAPRLAANALEMPLEGAQEVAEAAAGRAGANAAAGTDRDLTEDSFGDFVLGAAAAGPAAVLHSATGGDPAAPASAIAPLSTPPAAVVEAPQAAVAPLTSEQVLDLAGERMAELRAIPTPTAEQSQEFELLRGAAADPVALATAMGVPFDAPAAPAASDPGAETPIEPPATQQLPMAAAPAARSGAQAGAIIDQRLTALDDEAKLGRLTPDQATALADEDAELERLLRAQDRAKSEGVRLSPKNALTDDERAFADQRRLEIRGALEKHRAALGYETQAASLRAKLDRIDSDPDLIAFSEKLSPTAPPDQPAAQPSAVALATPAAAAPARMAAATRDTRIAELSQSRDTLDEPLRTELLDLVMQDRDQARVMGSGAPIEGVRKFQALAQAEKSGTAPPLRAFVDADNFKSLNDRLGHSVGDEAIQTMGQFYAEAFGPDAVFHKGGDEFVIAGADEAQLRGGMEKVRQRLAQKQFVAIDASGAEKVQNGLGISFGIGDSTNAAEQRQYDDKRARADAGLRTERGAERRTTDPGQLGPGLDERRLRPGEDRRAGSPAGVTPPAPVPARTTDQSFLLDGAERVDDGMLLRGDPTTLRAGLGRIGIRGAFARRGEGIILQGKPLQAFDRWQRQQGVSNEQEPESEQDGGDARDGEREIDGSTGGEVTAQPAAEAAEEVPEGVAEPLKLEEAQFARDDDSDAAPRGVPIEQVRAEVDSFLAEYRGNIPVTARVVDSLDEAYGPGATEKLGRNTTGAFHPKSGIVVLAAANLRNAAQIRRSLRHELLTHYGLHTLEAADKLAVLERVASTRPGKGATTPGMRKLWAEIEQRYGDVDPLMQAEEVIALAAERESSTLGKAWDSIVTTILEALRKVRLVSGAITPAEIRSLIESIGRGIRAGTAVQQNFPQSDDAQFRKGAGSPPPASPTTAVNPASWNAPEPSRLDDVIYALQDKHVDLRRVVSAIRQSGKAIADRTDPYLQEELYHGRAARRTQEFLESELKPLLQDLKAKGVEPSEFEQYLHARHAEERNVQIAKVNPKMPDGGSGMDTADAQAFLAGLSPPKARAMATLAARIDAINGQTQRLLVGYGLESQDTVDAWNAAYQHYVPLQREDMDHGAGTGQGYSVKGPATKRATGSKKKVVDILANIAMQRERAIVRGEKNRVATALIGLATSAPNADFWTVDRPPMIRRIDDRTGLVVETVDPMHKMRPNVITARFPQPNGEIAERILTLNDRDDRAMRLAEAFKNLDGTELGWFLGAAGKVTRYLAAINTQWNPIFGFTNFARDVQGAALNLSTTPIAGKQAEVAKETLSALRSIYADLRDIRAGRPPSSAWAAEYAEFRGEGAQTGYRDMFRTSRERADEIETEFRRLSEGKIRGSARAVFDWLSDFNEAIENSTRIAAYKVAKDNGLTKQRAASLAKNLTVNFNRKGAAGAQAGALYAFFNASVQGTARLAETMTGPAGKAIAAGGVMLGVAQALALAAAGFDDDDPPEFVRQRNLIIPIGDGKYSMIPMPLGFHVLPNIGRSLTEYALGGFEDGAKRVVDLIGLTMEAFNPIGSAGLSAQTLTPSAIDPLVALGENQDWSGRPIYQEDFSSLDPKPGHQRAKDGASWIGKALSYASNVVSGGTDFTPGAFSPTPDQIDYLVGQAFGGVGRELTKGLSTAELLWSGDAIPSHKIPLFGRFYGDTEGPTAESSKFYNNLRTLNMHQAEVRGRQLEREPVQPYYDEHPEARLFAMGDAAQRHIAALRDRRRELEAAEASDAELQRIEDSMQAAMKRLNDAVRKAEAD